MTRRTSSMTRAPGPRISWPPRSLLLALISTRAACAVALAADLHPAQAAQGKQAYDKTCAACHGANLDDGEFAPAAEGRRLSAALGRKASRSVLRPDDSDDATRFAGVAGRRGVRAVARVSRFRRTV